MTLLHRPVVSEDGNIIVSLGSDFLVRVFHRHGVQLGLRKVWSLPTSIQPMLNRLSVLKLSPLKLASDHNDVESLQSTPLPLLLLSDGNRLVVLDPAADSEQTHGLSTGLCLKADYQLGDQFGKLTYADFMLDSDHVLVLFELAAHASILSVNKPQRDDVPDVKFRGAQGLSISRKLQTAILLLRVKGQDRIAVLTSKDGEIQIQTSFSTSTSDAQGLSWSPNGDPVLAVWDSPAYGTKMHFFSALGHPLGQLDISELPNSSVSNGIGISAVEWVSTNTSTMLATADGHRQIHIRDQNNRNMTTKALATLQHPQIIDGSKAIVWQQEDSGGGSFSLQKGAFDATQQANVGGDCHLLGFNADCTFLATVLVDNPRTIWVWQPEHPEPHTIVRMQQAVRQILWHPEQTQVLLIVTAQKTPTMYSWFSETKPPTAFEMPLSDDTSSKFEGLWLRSGKGQRCPFLLTSTRALDVGLLHNADGKVVYQSMLSDLNGLEEMQNEDMTEEILTPSRPARGKATGQMQEEIGTSHNSFELADPSRW